MGELPPPTSGKALVQGGKALVPGGKALVQGGKGPISHQTSILSPPSTSC